MSDAPGQTGHKRIRSTVALSLVLLLSAYIQFTVVTRTQVVTPFRADALEYFSSAYNLDHYGVYSSQVTWPPEQHLQAPPADAVRTPGYPFFLRMVGHPEPTMEYESRIKLMQAVLGVFSVFMMYLIAARFLRQHWACMAALFTAISPHLAVSSTQLLTESLFFFLLLACILALLHAIDSAKRWPYALVGLAWGLCSLVRPTIEFLPILGLLAVMIIPRLRACRPQGILLLLGLAVAVSPWLIRNLTLPVQSNRPSQMVLFMMHGSYPNFMYKNNPATYGDPYRWDPHEEDSVSSMPTVLSHIAQNFWNHPVTYARWYLIGKPGFFLSWTNIESSTDNGGGDIFVYPVIRTPFRDDTRFIAMRNLAFILHWPLMLLGLVGACMPWHRPQRWGLTGKGLIAARLVSLVVLYAIGFHMIGAPYPRYGVPFRPLLYPLALMAVVGLWNARRTYATASDPGPAGHDASIAP